MPQITLDTADAAELAEILTFLTNWLSGSQKPILAGGDVGRLGWGRGTVGGNSWPCAVDGLGDDPEPGLVLVPHRQDGSAIGPQHTRELA